VIIITKHVSGAGAENGAENVANRDVRGLGSCLFSEDKESVPLQATAISSQLASSRDMIIIPYALKVTFVINLSQDGAPFILGCLLIGLVTLIFDL